MSALALLALLAASYLLGAIPSSYIAGRFTRGIDLREHGSGNLGATNTFRVLGWRTAAPVMAFDMLKGFVPTFYFPLLYGAGGTEWGLAYGAAAIVGHVLPVYTGFRGGKGVATGAGVFLALAPLAVLVGLAVWVLLLATTRIVSLASIIAAAALPPAVLLTAGPGTVFWLSLALAALVLFAHRSNMGRLLRGEEAAFRRVPPSSG